MTPLMTVLVCGSRTFNDERAVRAALALLPRGTKIIHGGARGADKLAATVADSMGFQVEEFLPDYSTGRGRRAPLDRNLHMLDQNPDLVIAFWDGRSTGTKFTIDEARKRGIRVALL
jgi:hypothetical protein